MPTIFAFAGQNVFLDFIVIFLAKYVPYLFLLLFLSTIFSRKDRYAFLRNIFFTALSLLLSFGFFEAFIAYFIPRVRPFVAYGFEPLFSPPPTASFPSSHATILFTLVAIVFLLGHRKSAFWFFIGATIIGLARVYSGLHYPVDILAGAGLGLFSSLIVWFFLPKNLKKLEPIMEV